ncbi:tautomerase family protein [Caenispirillum bisanense]|uniref:4-oxalocrotonate tautomerase n=1 Tax=Caenispirillum bisanense TaxID=414052 RepID=A0A286H129_9PROT|nr:tautomerase family protein [Caenispirillum bisanense]SOE01014.1 4-oxalocrotonate tautomerase [Caenispirillum bisanense]
MPFVRITLGAHGITPDDRAALARVATTLMAEALGKRPDLTSVLVTEVPDAERIWTVGDAFQPQAAVVEAFITQGTNTPAEKADFIARMDAAVRRVLPHVAPATYVVLNEVAADAWGWGGRTQADRAAAQ